jgi:hypothetical protein
MKLGTNSGGRGPLARCELLVFIASSSHEATPRAPETCFPERFVSKTATVSPEFFNAEIKVWLVQFITKIVQIRQRWGQQLRRFCKKNERSS